MNRYYIKISGRGFLKDITKKYHNGWFSKQHNLSASFETEDEAKSLKQFAINKLKEMIKDDQRRIDGVACVVNNWNGYTKSKRNEILEKFDFSTYHIETLDDFIKHYWGYRRVSSSLKVNQNLLPKLEKSKIIFDECKILFFPNKKGKIEWVDATKSISRPSERIYCNGCGGVIPGARYLKIKGESRNLVYLCPFCALKLAESAVKVADTVPENLKKQYKQDAFMENL